MCHRVKNDVDPEWVGALFGKFAEEIGKFLLAFPTITVVGVMAGNDHDVSFVVEDRFDMDFPAFLSVMRFPGHTRVLAPFRGQEHSEADKAAFEQTMSRLRQLTLEAVVAGFQRAANEVITRSLSESSPKPGS